MKPKPQVKADPRRALPAVDRLLRSLQEARSDLPEWALAEAARATLGEERKRLGPPGTPETGREAPGPQPAPEAELRRRAIAKAQALAEPWPRRVVNGTGIVLHTNLGRAPLAPGAAAAVARAAASYGDLEFDLASGERGDRLARVAERLARLAGAEAAFAVNNNAAALLLVLNTFARGREVIVSRGELVEIGGSFRVPEILERAGARLLEVGSTNRTHRADYEGALGPRTGLMLKVHRSNFALSGFVAEVELSALAELARGRALPVVEDLGSGTLVELPGLPLEAFAPARLKQGADLVCFSGDKLLGGPQAGIILGRAEFVAALRRNPMARALRLDKLSLAALDWTLGCYLEGRAEREIPVLRQLCEPLPRLEARARRLAERLGKALRDAAAVWATPESSFVGGGSVPGFELPSWVVAIAAPGGAEQTSARLRQARVPVLARVRDERVLIDVRTLLADDEDAVEAALVEGVRGFAYD